MRRRLLFTLTAVALAVNCSACGNADGRYSVVGKVLYKGEPAEGATVYFHRKGPADPLHDAVPTAVVQKDGTFRLVSARGAEGAPPGAYDVLIEWRDLGQTRKKGQKGSRSDQPPPDRLRGRYFNRTRPVLQAQVQPQANYLDPFELKD
jgi:hypothetical protein